ncbi:MAG: hypothetical protein V4787_14955 [Pseudomonadota bacterium]
MSIAGAQAIMPRNSNPLDSVNARQSFEWKEKGIPVFTNVAATGIGGHGRTGRGEYIARPSAGTLIFGDSTNYEQKLQTFYQQRPAKHRDRIASQLMNLEPDVDTIKNSLAILAKLDRKQEKLGTTVYLGHSAASGNLAEVKQQCDALDKMLSDGMFDVPGEESAKAMAAKLVTAWTLEMDAMQASASSSIQSGVNDVGTGTVADGKAQPDIDAQIESLTKEVGALKKTSDEAHTKQLGKIGRLAGDRESAIVIWKEATKAYHAKQAALDSLVQKRVHAKGVQLGKAYLEKLEKLDPSAIQAIADGLRFANQMGNLDDAVYRVVVNGLPGHKDIKDFYTLFAGVDWDKLGAPEPQRSSNPRDVLTLSGGRLSFDEHHLLNGFVEGLMGQLKSSQGGAQALRLKAALGVASVSSSTSQGTVAIAGQATPEARKEVQAAKTAPIKAEDAPAKMQVAEEKKARAPQVTVATPSPFTWVPRKSGPPAKLESVVLEKSVEECREAISDLELDLLEIDFEKNSARARITNKQDDDGRAMEKLAQLAVKENRVTAQIDELKAKIAAKL